MKLLKALEMCKEYGMENVGECIGRVGMSGSSLFTPESVSSELGELVIDYKALQSCTRVCDSTCIDVAIDLLGNELVKLSMGSYLLGYEDGYKKAKEDFDLV